MHDERISVIVPVHNVGLYIRRCVESILKQTYNNLEIILVDDGSTDESPAILGQLSYQDNRIRILIQKNEGVTSARLAGIEIATGEWISFVDGDDEIEPDMYERLYKNAIKYKADISHCGYQMIFPDRIDYYYNTGNIKKQNKSTGLADLLSGSTIEPSLCNKLFRRSLFVNCQMAIQMDRSIHNMEDLLMNYYLFREADSSVYEDFCPYHYLVRKGSAATSTLSMNKLDDPWKVFNIILDDISDNNELTDIIHRRLAGFLIGITTYSKCDNSDIVQSRRVVARKKLRDLLPVLRKSSDRGRLYVQCVLAVTSPCSYRFIHSIVSKLNGNAHKYEVR